jgi:hypothetical protein
LAALQTSTGCSLGRLGRKQTPGPGEGSPMIENEQQRQKALAEIQYWKTTGLKGDQSWLAGEQARGEIMRLRKRVDEYELRTAEKSKVDSG